MKRLSPEHIGALLTVFAMLLFVLMDSMTKLLVRTYPVTETIWIRYVVLAAFALLMSGAGSGGIVKLAASAKPWLQTVRSLVALAEGAVFVVAFRFLPLADTHAVASASPLMVVALSAPLLGERVGLHRWLSVLAAFAGVMLIIRPGFAQVSWPLMLPLFGAFLWAAYVIMVRFLARDDRPETTLLWTAFVGLAVVSLVAPWEFQFPDATGWALLVAVGVLNSLAQYAMIRALDHAQASAIQPFGYTALVWASLMGWLVFGDLPELPTLLGACIVVLSGLYAWSLERKGP